MHAGGSEVPTLSYVLNVSSMYAVKANTRLETTVLAKVTQNISPTQSTIEHQERNLKGKQKINPQSSLSLSLAIQRDVELMSRYIDLQLFNT